MRWLVTLFAMLARRLFGITGATTRPAILAGIVPAHYDFDAFLLVRWAWLDAAPAHFLLRVQISGRAHDYFCNRAEDELLLHVGSEVEQGVEIVIEFFALDGTPLSGTPRLTAWAPPFPQPGR